MKITKSLLEKASLLVESVNDEFALEMAGCGCSGCGLGCSGTVGMD